MDLNALKMTDSTQVEILHPGTGDPVGITITLASKESARVRSVMHGFANARISEAARKPGKKTLSLKSEDLAEETVAVLVAATLGWTGVERDGQAVPCTEEEVRALYSDPGFAWIRAQVDAALQDASLFFQS